MGFPRCRIYTFVLHFDVLFRDPSFLSCYILPRLALCPGHVSFVGHTLTVPHLSDTYLRDSGSRLEDVRESVQKRSR